MDDRVRKVVISSSSCLVVMFCMVVMFSPNAEAAINCTQLGVSFRPCLSYIQGIAGPAPTAACCDRVKGLNSSVSTTQDRQTACQCLKIITRTVKSINLGNAAGLPGKCGIRLPFQISPNIDCSLVV